MAAGASYNPTAESPLAMPYAPVAAPSTPEAKPSPFGGKPGYQFNGGPISHAGAWAGVFDNVLHGLVNGHADREAHKALTLKKKSDDLNASYNADASRLYDVVRSQLQSTGKVDPSSPDYQAAAAAKNGSWGALQDFRGQLIEQQSGGKKKTKGKQGDQQQGNPVAAFLDKSAPIEERAKAAYLISGKLGAPVDGQIQTLIAQYASPRGQQQRQTEDTAAQTGGIHATNTLAHEQAQATYNKYAGRSEEELAKLPPAEQDAFKNAKAVLMPPTTKGTARQYESPDKTQHNWFVPGSEPEGWNAYNRPAASSTPKVGSFGDFMAAAFGKEPTPADYVKGRKMWAESGAGTTVGEHVVMVPQPDGTTKPVTIETTSTKSFGGGSAAPSTRQDGDSATSKNPPTVVTQSFHGKTVPGLVEKGNVDVANRPNIDNGDGTHSSTFSMSFGTDKGEVLVPGVGDGKTYPLRKLTKDEALDQYKKTGQNFGTFKDEKSANAYAETLHEDQAKYGNKPATSTPLTRRQRPAPAAASATAAPPARRGGAGVVAVGDSIGGKLSPPDAKEVTDLTKAFDDARAASQSARRAVQAHLRGEDASLQDKGIVLSWLKGRMNRVTQQEVNTLNNLGGLEMSWDGRMAHIVKGELSARQIAMFAKDAAGSYHDALGNLNETRTRLGLAPIKPASGGVAKAPVKMKAPDGSTAMVDPDHVEEAKKRGATVVQ